MTKEAFVQSCQEIGINLSNKQIQQFDTYYQALIEWNEKINLTAITQESEVYEKHFYDCLLLSQVINLDKQSICDVGAGAGFPSIPLKIVYPNLKVTIVDSLNKRIKFLDHLVEQLGLSDVKAVAARAEEFALDHRESFDIVTGRAVARLNILDELCLPLVKKDGYFIALKGKQGLIEEAEAKKGIDLLGGKLIESKVYNLPNELSERCLLLYQKVKATPTKYPRAFGQIKKNPL